MAKDSIRLTRFEMEIMEAVWRLGSASVREIQEQLPELKRPAYTTVQTIIYRLEEKGAVRRVKKIGNAHIFEATITRRAAVRRLVDELLDFFGGSPRTLMAQMVESGRLTLDDLRALEESISRSSEEEPAALPPTEDKPSARAKSTARAGRERRRNG